MDQTIDAAIRQAAALLKAAGARGVYLFGSEGAGTARAESDVEMAVAGLPPASSCRAVGLISGILRRPLDLVALDESTPFTGYLKKKGNLRRVA